MNPKRKCSFSSFNECRYLEDNGKTTTTYFFSSDAETLRPNREGNNVFDKMNSSDQLNLTVLKPEERAILPKHQIHQNGSPVKRAIKRNSKNVGYSNSFNVSADIRRKLFVNRYKEWSLQSSKPLGSKLEPRPIPYQDRFSYKYNEPNASNDASNTPLMKENKATSFLPLTPLLAA